MSRKPMQVLALPALVALVLLAPGCGGDEKSSGGSAGAPAKSCKEFEQGATQVGQQFQTALTGSGGSADVQEAARLFDELTGQAPDEIKSDFETINEAFQKLAKALEGVDLSSNTPPDAAKLAELQKITSEIDQAKLNQASQNITTWAQENCN